MKKISLLSLMTLFTILCMNMLQAQVNIGGNPVSYKYEKTGTLEPISFEQMPPLDMKTIEAEDAQWDADVAAGITKIGRRFGIEFEVDYDLQNSGTWANLPDGGKLWRLGIECPGALSINLIFDRYRLPKGSTVYVFAENESDKIGGFTDYNNQADNFFATDIVLSDKIVIEYYQPGNAAFDGELRLATVVHGYRGSSAYPKSFGQSGSCQRNTSCPEAETWQDQVRAVFALYNGGQELCSGTILNNTANDNKPYALTANHCWNAAQNPGTWVFRFRWESPTCTPTTNSSYYTMSGAVLRMRSLTNTSQTDACLVELNQPIPKEYNVYFAGWSRSTVPSPNAMCISHPALDIKKISPTLPLYTSNSYVLGWRANWSTAACTEGGSSGSGLFDSNGRLIGQLYGGLSACSTYGTSSHWDEYGRFDLSWDGYPTGVSNLKTWLDPLGLNPETWNGRNTEMIDAELADIIVPVQSYNSAATIEPKVTIKNSGDITITSATIAYTIDGGNPVTKTWEGTLAIGATTDITFDAITLTYGTHVFEATVTVPDDGNAANNSKTKNYEVTITNAPYVNYDSHEVAGGELLTYISTNKEIAVTLRNVGVQSATGPLNVTFSCDDPQLIITQATAQCGTIAPNGTATVTCKVTVTHDIPNNKNFYVKISVANSQSTWGSTMVLKAYAPEFKLEKVLVNGVENGNLPKDALVFLSATIKNAGGADAYKVEGNLDFSSPYLTLACSEHPPVIQLLHAGESSNLNFYVITNPNMPSGYEATLNLLLAAKYGRSYTAPFKVVNSGSSTYCIPSSSSGCTLNDRFTSVKLTKIVGSSVLINHSPVCNSAPSGYLDFTSIVVPIEPGAQYQLDVSVGSGGKQAIKGWFDLNGNNKFDNDEELFSGTCASSGSTSFTFTAPQNFTPGESRFRLRCIFYSTNPPSPYEECTSMTYGQTLDYTIVLPELYPRVQNVAAALQDKTITITWGAPATGSPIGYNIYRDGNLLNATPVNETTFAEENIKQGVYAYSVKAVYTGNKESFAEMSNVICNFFVCEKPVNVEVTVTGKTATLTWEDSPSMAAPLLGYNVYRNGTKLNAALVTEKTFKNEPLIAGTYCYQVSSVYEEDCESELTDCTNLIFCEPPVNLHGEQLIPIKGFYGMVQLMWKTPEHIDGVLLGYNVFRDDVKINEALVTDTLYIDIKEFPAIGTYNYQVSALYENCESALTEPIAIFVYDVGITDFHTSSFNIFPNPTTGTFTIQGDGLQRLEIYDVQGRILFEQNAEGRKQNVINVSHLQAGIYFVKIYSENNVAVTKQLVIIK